MVSMKRSGFNIALLLLLLFPGLLPAQKRLERMHVDTSGRVSTFGPNRLFFAQVMAHGGWFVDEGEPGAATTRAFSAGLGARLKLKLWSWEALTMDAGWKMQRWRLEQKPGKLIPDGNLHQRENITLYAFSVDLCNRINIGRRGNVLGTFVDFGVYADWNFQRVHTTKDIFVNPAASGKESQITRNFGPSWLANENYGIKVRAGNGWADLFAAFRVSSIFSTSFENSYPEPPRLVIGIELGTE